MLDKYTAVVVVVLATAASACKYGAKCLSRFECKADFLCVKGKCSCPAPNMVYNKDSEHCSFLPDPEYGENCKDRCQHDLLCLKGICQCPYPNMDFDESHQHCLIIPGHGESCSDHCKADLECVSRICQCPSSSHVYNETTGRCSSDPGFGERCRGRCQHGLLCQKLTCRCPYDNMVYDDDHKECTSVVCLNNGNRSCFGKKDGDYPICNPDCTDGQYITCLNGFLYVRHCGYAYYGQRLFKQVYDPILEDCEKTSSYCPRDLDKLVN